MAGRSAAHAPQLPPEEVERVRALLQAAALRDARPTSTSPSAREPRFKAWYRYNTRAHRVPGYRAVFVSLKAHGAAPGDMSAAQMEAARGSSPSA